MRRPVIAGDDIVRTRAEAGDREPLLVVEPLVAFLDAHGLGEGEPAFEAIGDGHSNVTFAVTRSGRELVVRRPPRGPLPPSAHDVLREARVLRALAGRVPVPEVLAVCEDPSVIGAPFYVMPRIGGVVMNAAPAPELAGHERATGEAMIDALVELHAVDWR
ncbi:MAG TPA: phosphotransferase, partial [Solirubrobacteraceae bacterium]|nr:phosphotransferase [Solirubrobacteraceae bacterium]